MYVYLRGVIGLTSTKVERGISPRIPCNGENQLIQPLITTIIVTHFLIMKQEMLSSDRPGSVIVSLSKTLIRMKPNHQRY